MACKIPFRSMEEKASPHVSRFLGFRPRARRKLGERRALELRTNLRPRNSQNPRSPRSPQSLRSPRSLPPHALHRRPRGSQRVARRR